MAERLDVQLEWLTPETYARLAHQIVMHPGPAERLVTGVGSSVFFVVALHPETGEVVGQGGINPDAPSPHLDERLRNRFERPTPAIVFMQTDPEFQRRSVATQVLGALVAQAAAVARPNQAGRKEIFLTVETDNPGAQELYRQAGFVDWGEGTFEGRSFAQNPDGSWPAEPKIVEAFAMVKDVTDFPIE